ncbi:MAG: fibronectin type III domain-containing protein [Bdellovibrionaceae bacterium]|nr:fibronectin type III domain-containing protein [Pseudobdellovibrionaceae bacterium]
MKSFCVFILGLIVTVNFAAANEPAHKVANDTMCSTEKDAQCDDKAHAADAQTSKSKNKDWTPQRLKQVAEVMPQPQEDKSKADKPSMVKLTSPKFLSTLTGSDVKFEWTKSDNAKVYHIQVSRDAGFNNRSMYVANNNAVAETSFEVKNLEPNTKYFWRVAAYNNEMKAGYAKSNFTSSAFSTK